MYLCSAGPIWVSYSSDLLILFSPGPPRIAAALFFEPQASPTPKKRYKLQGSGPSESWSNMSCSTSPPGGFWTGFRDSLCGISSASNGGGCPQRGIVPNGWCCQNPVLSCDENKAKSSRFMQIVFMRIIRFHREGRADHHDRANGPEVPLRLALPHSRTRRQRNDATDRCNRLDLSRHGSNACGFRTFRAEAACFFVANENRKVKTKNLETRRKRRKQRFFWVVTLAKPFLYA